MTREPVVPGEGPYRYTVRRDGNEGGEGWIFDQIQPDGKRFVCWMWLGDGVSEKQAHAICEALNAAARPALPALRYRTIDGKSCANCGKSVLDHVDGSLCAAPAAQEPPDKELRFRVQRFLEYVADVRAGRVKRLDRDVVLGYAKDIEETL